MRFSTILMVCGACSLLGATGCASVQKMEKEAQAEVGKNPAVMKGAEDEAATVAAKAEIGKNAKAKGVDVSVKAGVATLSGATPEARAEAEKSIKSVPGVTKVNK
jgi:osmotically-inducible protein OsmY